jgi:LacI family transcriptional regulator
MRKNAAQQDHKMSIVAVAKKAGVSVATVSRVINDLNNVRAETVQQVRAAMQEMGYTPPRVKRGPKGGPRRAAPACMRTGQIAIVTVGAQQNWLGLPVMSSVVTGVMRAAKETDVRPILDEMPDPEILSPMLRRREVDGAIIFFMSGLPVHYLTRLKEHLPVVWAMGGEDVLADVDHVSADNHGVGHVAYDYLKGQKCERLAFISKHSDWALIRLRAQAFANAARDDGKQISSFLVNAQSLQREAYGDDVQVRDSLDAAVDALVSLDPRPTGLFIPTDLETTHVYPLLIARGIRPQRDIRVISCDNEEERLSMLHPRPASIDIRGEQVGRWALRQLINRLERPNDPPVRLQVRPTIVAPKPRVEIELR